MKLWGIDVPTKWLFLLTHIANSKRASMKYTAFVQIGLDEKKGTPVVTVTTCDAKSLELFELAIAHKDVRYVTDIAKASNGADVFFEIADGE